MSQLARLSHEVAVLSSKLDRLTAKSAPVMGRVFTPIRSPGSGRRDVGDLLKSAASHGSFAKASQRPPLAVDSLFLKGNPEFNPDQPRGEDGKWTASGVARTAAFATGAVALAALATVAGIVLLRNPTALTASQQALAQRWLGGTLVSGGTLQMGKLTSADQVRRRMMSFFPDARLGFQATSGGTWAGAVTQGDDLRGLFVLDPSKRVVFVNFMHSADTPAGFDAAKRYMMMLVSFARDSNAKSITTVASMEMGGYAWPRAGFEVSERSAGMVKLFLTSRFSEISRYLTPEQRLGVSNMLRNFDKHTPAKLARLDDAVPALAMRAAGDVRGQPTLGKALLARTEGEYVLPRAKFSPMGKRLAKMLGLSPVSRAVAGLFAA